jgi:hypothetical protein
MTDENLSDEFDAFDNWLRTCPPVAPPLNLRERCLMTIPMGPNRELRPLVRPRPKFASVAKVVAAISATIAATLAIAWLSGAREQSVFAQAIEQSAKAPAIHIVETFIDPEARPGLLATGEWWVIPGDRQRRVCKNNNEVEFVNVKSEGNSTIWFPGRNVVEIKPNHEAVGNLPYFTDATLSLRRFEDLAKQQKVPITVETIEKDGKALRRIQIKDLREDKLADAELMLTLIVDIDSATNRIVRTWSHEWAVGKERANYASLNSTHVMDLNYPTPSSLPDSLFKVDYPAGAKVTRENE